MEDHFKDRVKQIILDHLDDEHFGVDELASEIGLSRSQTYRKVKSLYKKSVNLLIKETRLQEAAKLILESDLNASEISYKVGFSSPSYFNNCFHKYFGIPPGEYKEKYKDNPALIDFGPASSPSRIKKYLPVFYILGVVSLLFGINLFINNKAYISQSDSPKKSIAVLYFDDYSPESDKQWFCNAITEEITAKLASIKNLNVIGRTSVKQFRNSDKSIPEIAKALGVDYIIEGSMAMDNNKIKITTQLINANNEHIWHKEYVNDFIDVFVIQQHVAKQIAEQLKIKLSPEEKKSIAHRPTENLEAFQMFSQGVALEDTRTKEGLAASVNLFKKAIDLDPNYAEAYAELAAAYRLIYVYSKFSNDINYKKINALLDKSLEINPNTVRAYTTKGMINISHKNWVKAKENYEIALALNPNDATLHHYYAIYFSVKPDSENKKALEHINIAQKLNPYSYPININKIDFLLKNDNLNEAEEFYQRNISFFTEKMKLNMQLRFITYKAKTRSIENKDWNEAIKFYHKAIKESPKNIGINTILAMNYNEILNDAKNYLKYAKIAYNLDSINRQNAYFYYHSLLKNKKFIEAKKLLQNENFNSLFIEKEKMGYLFYWYYKQGYYKKALTKLDKYKYENHFECAINLAQQNKVKETYRILNNDVLKCYKKAVVFAILEERDSMYYHLDKEKDIYNILEFNGFTEIDPIRKDVRYKSFLKKHFLPIN